MYNMLYYKTKTLLIFSATVLEKDQGMKKLIYFLSIPEEKLISDS